MNRLTTRGKRFGVVLAAASMLLAACGGSSSSSSSSSSGPTAVGTPVVASAGGGGGAGGTPIKVAFVYVGPIGDAGWTKKHDDGRKAMESALAGKVTTSYLENVPEGAQSQAVFERLAREGNKVIFGTSFGYMDQMVAVAAKHPEVTFMHATGYKASANMGTYFGAAEQARYLSGLAAGSMTKTNKIGYVAAFPIPEVIRGINAFTLGAQKSNPKVEVNVVWTSTWFNPTQEKEAAQSVLNGGADVVAQHQDTPSAGEAAQAAGKYWVGYNDDMSKFAPKAWLTAPVWDWGPYYTKTVSSVIDGSWKSEQYYGNMADGLVKLSPVANTVPQATRDAIATAQAAIIAGTLQPFTGPISKQDGSVAYPAGKSATQEELLKMDYFVKGVNGNVKGS